MPVPLPRAGEKRHKYVRRVFEIEVKHGKPDDQAWKIAYESWRRYEGERKVAQGGAGRRAEGRLRMARAAASARKRSR